VDDTGAQLLFRLVAPAYERRALGICSHWPLDQWGRLMPEHTTAVSLLDRLLHRSNVVVTEGESFRVHQAVTEEVHAPGRSEQPRGVGTFSWPPAGTTTAWP
jgi:DNA replication protein DnaC